MIEHPLAQIVLHAFAQDAGQIDEAEDARRLQRGSARRMVAMLQQHAPGPARMMPSSMIRLLRKVK